MTGSVIAPSWRSGGVFCCPAGPFCFAADEILISDTPIWPVFQFASRERAAFWCPTGTIFIIAALNSGSDGALDGSSTPPSDSIARDAS
jgi:hypothetical protein